jgi:hypothetical protein
MDTSVAADTVSVAPGEVTPPELAVIVVVPVATAVAIPDESMVAVAVLEEVQVTLVERFCVVWSLNVPVAVNLFVVCGAIRALGGVMAMETSTACVTVSVAAGEMIAPWVAVIVVVPMAKPVATPEVFIVAVAVFEEVHVTLFVKFCVVSSL